MKKLKSDSGFRQMLNRLRGRNSGRAKLKGVATISARKIHKDGTVEDLGIIYRKGGKANGEPRAC